MSTTNTTAAQQTAATAKTASTGSIVRPHNIELLVREGASATQQKWTREPGQGPVTHVVKAKQSVAIRIDGQDVKGGETVEGQKLKLKKVGNDLLVETESGETLVYLDNFYDSEGALLVGTDWVSYAGESLASATWGEGAGALAGVSHSTGIVPLAWLGGALGVAALIGNDGDGAITKPMAPSASQITIGSGSSKPGYTNDTTPTIAGAGATPGHTITVVIGGQTLTTTVAADGTWSVTPTTPLPEGSYQAVITATDAAGNVSEPASFPLTVDTTVPAAPVAPSIAVTAGSDTGVAGDGITSDNTPTIAGTGATPGDTMTVVIGGQTLTATVAADGTWSVTPTTPLPDGTYTPVVTATDPAGNVSAPTTLAPLTVDATAPAAPAAPSIAVTAGSDTGVAGDGITSDNTPTIAGTGATPGETMTVVIGGQTLTATVAADGTWAVTPSPALTDGTYTPTVTATDAAGNVSAPTTLPALTVDTTPPAAPAAANITLAAGSDTGAAGDGITNDTTPTIGGTGATPGETMTVVIGGQTLTATVAADGTWAVTPSPALTDGTYTPTVTATDAAGNVSAPTTLPALTIDSTPPAPPTYTLSTGANIGPQSVINGSAEPNSTVQVTLDLDNNPATDNNVVYTVTASATGTWSINLANAAPVSGTPNFTPGATVDISAVSLDDSGNASAPANGDHTVPMNTPTLYSIYMVDANDQVISAVNEGETARYMVVRSGDLSAAGTVAYASENGSAQSGSDYTAATGTLSFAAGESKKYFTLATATDAAVESNETLVVRLSAPTAGILGVSSVETTLNDMGQSTWSIDAVQTEVLENATKAVFTVSRTGASGAATIDWLTASGTALAGSDYTAVAPTALSFAAGEMSKTVEVLITDDANLEPIETLGASIVNASSGTIARAEAIVNILDNDQSIWSIASNGDVSEAAGKLYFTVSRVGATADAATVTFSTGGGTAIAGFDYTSSTQTLNFAAGETSKLVSVDVTNDTAEEGIETVIASISVPAGSGTIENATATASIIDDDQAIWSIVADQAEVSESAASMSFTITRTLATAPAEIVFSANTGTATAGSDYTAVNNQVVSFAAGELSKTIVVALSADDNTPELNETVIGSISTNANSGGTVDGNATTAAVTILDNDQSIFTLSAPSEVSETAGYITYTITRTGSDQATTIEFMTNGGTAIGGATLTEGVDYKDTAFSGASALAFAQGEMSKTVQVQIQNDLLAEGNETVSAMITAAGFGSSIDGAQSSVTTSIIDDESTVWTLEASATTVDEGAGSVTFTITRQGKSEAQSITFATVGGNATVNQDYVHTPPIVVNFGVGEMVKTVTVALTEDTTIEPNEFFTAVLSSPTEGIITTSSVNVQITDNDQSLWNISKVSDALEGQPMQVRVWRSGTLGAATIELVTSSAVAEAGKDYTNASQTLTFAAGEESKIISIASLTDALPEATEYVTARILNPNVGSVSVSEATVAITDTMLSTWRIDAAGTAQTIEGGALSFTISRSGDVSQAATIMVGIGGGTATGGVDFVTQPLQTLSFAAGEASKTYFVETLPNLTLDVQRNVTVTISEASSGTLEVTSATAEILDDEGPAWTITALGDAEEGTRMGFVVARDGGRDAATIEVASVGGTAIGGTAAGGAVDYARYAQTLSFAAGEMEKIIWVDTYADTNLENHKTVTMGISKPSSGTLTTPQATGTLLDNDSMIWAVRGVSGGVEGGPLVYEVYRTGGDFSAATVRVGHNGFSAIVGADHEPVWQTLSFADGQKSQLVTVQTIDDSLAEGSETVSLDIGNVSKGFISGKNKDGQYEAHTTITDNDANVPVFNISAPKWVPEGLGFVTVTVTRTNDTNVATTVDYRTVDGGLTSANNNVELVTAVAKAGEHYTEKTGTLSFAAGETTKSFNIPLINNTLVDGPKSFSVLLLNPSNGVIWRSSGADALGSAVIMIGDDEKAAAGSVPASSFALTGTDLTLDPTGGVLESTGHGIFTLVRSGDLAETTTYFRTGTTGTAVAGTDYTATTQTLTWAVGETTKTIMVALTDDALLNGTRTVVGEHSADNSTWDVSGTLNILDDEATFSGGVVSYTIDRASYLSAELGGAFYIVDRNGDLSQTTTSYITLYGGENSPVRNVDWTWEATTTLDATSGREYATLTWAPGETSKVIAARFIDNGVAGSGRVSITARHVTSLADLTSGGVATGVIRGFDSVGLTLTNTAEEQHSSAARILDFLGGNDTYIYTWTEASASDQVRMGAGNDLVSCALNFGYMGSTGFYLDGGTGLDVIELSTTSGYNANNVASYHYDFSNHFNSFYGVEMLRMNTYSSTLTSSWINPVGNKTLGKDMVSFNLSTLVEMTKDNANPHVFKVVSQDTSSGMNDTFRISDALGKTLYTPAVGSTFTGVNGESGTVVADSDGDGANEVVLVKDQSHGQNQLAYGSTTQETFDIFQYDYNGVRMSVLVQKGIHFIGSQPTATLTAGTGNDSGSATVSSTAQGTAYLVKSDVAVTDVASIKAAADASWNSVAIDTGFTNTTLSLAGLSDGTYHLYTSDVDGTLSKAATVNGASTTFTVENVAPAELTLVMPTYTSPGTAAVAHVQGLETAAGTTWQYQIGTGGWVTGSGTSFQLPAGFEASPQTVQVRQIDAAGNVGAVRTSTDATGVIAATAAQELKAWLVAADALATGGKESWVTAAVGGQLARLHTYNTVTGTTALTSSFASTAALDVDYTLVGGGGGGLVKNGSVLVDAASSTTITVGAGGMSVYGYGNGAAGGTTTAAFSAGSVSALGGMGGKGAQNNVTQNAGSNTVGGTGGGAGNGSTSGVYGTGAAGAGGGGSGANASAAGAGGGGGAGGDASGTTGGVGLASSITGLLYGGGGAGATNTATTTAGGVGGNGGGGAGLRSAFADVVNPAGESAGPAFNNARIHANAANVLNLVYNELLDPLSIAEPAAYTVMVNGGAATVNSVAVVGNVVQLTLATAVTTGQTVTVAYNDAVNIATMQDLRGNDAASITTAATVNTNFAAETTLPTRIVSFHMHPARDKVVMAFNELLDPTNLPAPSSFTVKTMSDFDTTTTTQDVAVTKVEVQGAAVILTLAEVISGGSTNVMVGYTDPTTGNDTLAIQDLLGNDAASVVNSTGGSESSWANPDLTNGVDGLGGGGGGTAGGITVNRGGRGGSGTALLAYEADFDEAALLTFLQNIETGVDGTGATTLVQSNLHVYLNAIETAAATDLTWEWTNAKIAAVL